ncbi:hypothetical protein [Tepidimonas fonticaldi]|uniref:hypothetical protein n=1 Tax=Tepidimonas fonticaldi TaxID=1101373 RepID=UPI0012E76190|nr:hypothetical protein [Tepidimonas fonticaldi]
MVFKMNPPGTPLPDNHPLKPGLIIFGARRSVRPSQASDTATPDLRDSDPNRPETEEDGFRADQLRQLKVIHDARVARLRSIDSNLPSDEKDRLAAKINDEAEQRRALVMNKRQPTMPSQLEFLRASLARLEAEGAPSDNPMVQGLRAQIAMHERDHRRRETGGFWDEDGKIKPEWQNPMS